MIKTIMLPAKEYKRQATKAVLSLVLFFSTYIILTLLAIGLTVLCVYGGVMLIVYVQSIITIMLGVGLASMGFLVLLFLFKFIFKSHKVDRSHLIEVSKTDEPELFNLINEIVNKVGTRSPKKVYLSADVNAGVFYDSSFWSMFFPVKKNLTVGLGLLNSITSEELKAILSHEFGHFSQKTMRVGSYVYNVNQVIYNLLYDNVSFDKLIETWSGVSHYFTFFSFVAIKIMNGIQLVLRNIYGIINISYLELSRQMEFHADEVAASVTGYSPLKKSLLRLDLAEHSYNAVLNFYDKKIKDNIVSENIYKEQLFVMQFIAEENNLAIEKGFPIITLDTIKKYNKSKLIIKDQWASHPSIQERVKILENLNIIKTDIVENPSNGILSDVDTIHQKVTKRIFDQVNYSGKLTYNTLENFIKDYKDEYSKNTFDKVYNGYYDNKQPVEFDIENLLDKKDITRFDDLFSDEKVDLIASGITLQNDINVLTQISIGNNKIRTFDYDGKKYNANETIGLIEELKNELDVINVKIKNNDILIFQYFQTQEIILKKEPKLSKYYSDFFSFDKDFEVKLKTYSELSNATQFMSYTTPYDQISKNLVNVNAIEKNFREAIKGLLNDEKYKPEINDEIIDSFNLYLSKEWVYFGYEQYYNKNLEVLFNAMNNYCYLIFRVYFLIKKKLLNYQAGLMI